MARRAVADCHLLRPPGRSLTGWANPTSASAAVVGLAGIRPWNSGQSPTPQSNFEVGLAPVHGGHHRWPPPNPQPGLPAGALATGRSRHGPPLETGLRVEWGSRRSGVVAAKRLTLRGADYDSLGADIRLLYLEVLGQDLPPRAADVRLLSCPFGLSTLRS